MTTKLKLYQNACLILKQRPITSLTQDIEIRHQLDLVYDDAVQAGLEAGDWNFAMRSAAIEPDTAVEPSFGYNYAFEKPVDWVKTSSISGSPNYWPALGALEFADETDSWHANYNPLYASWVSNDVSYGLDLSRWTETFAQYVAHELAYRIAGQITGMGQDSIDALEKRRNRRLLDARSKDALNQAAKIPPPGRLVKSRGGIGSRGMVWRNG